MIGILGMILPVVLPMLTDGVRGIFAKFTGGAGGQPVNLDERIKLMAAETEKLKALAELDKPTGDISRWVADLRGSFRYISIIVIWLVAGAAVLSGAAEAYTLILLEISGMCLSFVIGERFYLKVKGG